MSILYPKTIDKVQGVRYNVYMIQKTIYLRDEDLEAFNAISNKALWIHGHLGSPAAPPTANSKKVPRLPYGITGTVITKQVDYSENVPVGRACCLKRDPRCQHWVYESKIRRYTNKLTGEREFV